MTDTGPPEYKYKMVDGELVELTPEEIAELQQRDRDAMMKPASETDPAASAAPPPQQQTTEEHHHERGRSKRR